MHTTPTQITSKTRLLKLIDKTLTYLTVIAAVLLLLKVVAVQQVNVVGQSMQPNYMDGEKLLLNKLPQTLSRGQVVSVYETREMSKSANLLTKTFPNLSGVPIKFLLKRVIGVPGDTVEILGSKVIIYNSEHLEGKILEEYYIDTSVKQQMELGCASYPRYQKKVVVQDNSYFLMGDNRCNSLDSRNTSYGPFESSMLLGSVVMRYWPVGSISGGEIGKTEWRSLDAVTQNELSTQRR